MNVNEVAKLKLNDTGTVTLTIDDPTNGGDVPPSATDATKKLQYTSDVGNAVTRKITAAWGGTDAAPAGTQLNVEATSVVAGCGTAVGGGYTLPDNNATAGNIITGIGSCKTGSGVNGSGVTYTFSVTDITLMVAGATKTVTITFTLTDAS
jgi:hypothetical protein